MRVKSNPLIKFGGTRLDSYKDGKKRGTATLTATN